MAEAPINKLDFINVDKNIEVVSKEEAANLQKLLESFDNRNKIFDLVQDGLDKLDQTSKDNITKACKELILKFPNDLSFEDKTGSLPEWRAQIGVLFLYFYQHL